MNTDYKKQMRKCISLAKKGEGYVSPNPLVGAVVLDKNNVVAGYGFHQKLGEAHAEVNALKMAGDKARGGTIIVNLEPCSHYGKTPPCADLIIKTGIKKLIVGVVDPNPKVAGKGIKKCTDAGIEVITGVLKDECLDLNEIFFKNQITKKPFIAIKIATTSDGKIAAKTGDSKWITSEKSRNIVQKLRNKYDAILTGSNTVIIDNPSMNCRIRNTRSPIRVLVDSNLASPPSSSFFKNDGTKVIVAVKDSISEKQLQLYPANVEFLKCPLKNGKIDLVYLTQKLFAKGIYSILVEAGGTLNGAMLKEQLVDKIYHFIAPKVIGDRCAKNWVEGFDLEKINESIKLNFKKVTFLSPDVLIESNVELLGEMT